MRFLIIACLFSCQMIVTMVSNATTCPTDDLAPAAGVVNEELQLSAADRVRAEALHHQIDTLRGEGKHGEALPLATELLELYRRELGREHLQTFEAMSVMAHLLFQEGRADEAEARYRELLDSHRRLLGNDHEKSLQALHELSFFLVEQARYEEAEPLLAEALETARRALAPDHPMIFELLDQQGYFLMLQGHYEEGKAAYLDMLETCRSVLVEEHHSVARAHAGLASACQELGDWIEAEAEYDTAIDLFLELHGENHSATISAILDRAGLLVRRGRLAEAEADYRRAVDGRRRLFGDTHPKTGMALNGLGVCFNSQARYDEAETCFREALQIDRQLLGDDHPKTCLKMMNLGHVLVRQWRLPEAEPLLRRALSGFQASQGDDYPRTISAQLNLAGLLMDQGRLEQSETLIREALEARIRVHGPDHWRTLSVMNNLGNLLMKMGRLEEAETLLRETLAKRRESLGVDHKHTQNTISNLGLLLQRIGELAEAEALLFEGLEARRRIYGEDHHHTMIMLSHYGRLVAKRGRLEEAERLTRDAVKGLRRAHGPTHPRVTATLIVLAAIQYGRDDLERATGTWLEAVDSFEATRLQSGVKGLERAHFATGYSPMSDLAICLARNGKTLEAWERFEAGLARGLLDTVTVRHARSISREEEQRESDLIERLGEADERLGRLYGNDTEDDGDREEAIGNLQTERNRVLEELSTFQTGLLKRYGHSAGEVFDLKRIQAQIPADTAIIGWIDRISGAIAHHPTLDHWACLLRRNGDPILVTLPGSGEKGAWTRDDFDLGDQLRETLGKRARRATARRQQALIQRLRRQRIEPLAAHLAGIEKLVVLPAGLMAGIPVELLARDYTISYTPSGTMYAWLRENPRSAGRKGVSPLLALGDPALNPPEDPQTTDNSATRAAPPPGPEQQARLDTLAPLPGSRLEVEAIAGLFTTTGEEPGPLVLLGSAASEQRLDELSRSGRLDDFRYIHLATHGVMDDQVAMRSALLLARDQLADSLDRVINGEAVFDGWLTGEQIVRTWTIDADLVTLSGCETALGREAGGEGFLGFSQALFAAGARSLVLSLWKVDDRATMLLMERFYRNLLGRYDEPRSLPTTEFPPGTPLPRAEALREAKLWLSSLTDDQVEQLVPDWLRSRQRGSGTDGRATEERLIGRPFADPRYWAAFILLGDPG